MTTVHDAWIAGLLDSRAGGIYIKTVKDGGFKGAVWIEVPDRPAAERVCSLTGLGGTKQRGDNWRWAVRNEEAIQFLERVIPYMCTKRDMAEFYIKLGTVCTS